jgi:hypothetical protein
MADDTVKCPSCGFENVVGAARCAKPYCGVRLSGAQFSELEYLKSIDGSLRTIKTIVVFWLVLFVAALAIYLIGWAMNRSISN